MNVVTNATLLEGDLARRAVEAGAKTFEVTLLSSDARVHDALARGKAFDAALSGISNILGAGGRLTVSFVATKMNIADLRGAIELAVALRARGLAFNRFNPGGEGLGLAGGAVEVQGRETDARPFQALGRGEVVSPRGDQGGRDGEEGRDLAREPLQFAPPGQGEEVE